MKYEKISIKALVLWEIMASIIFILLLSLVLFIFAPRTIVWYIIIWTLGALFVLTEFLYLPILYLNVEYAVSDKVIVYKKGVFFRHTQYMYRDSIVFATVYNNPLTPILRISSLVITSPGASIKILYIQTKRAEKLANVLAGVAN